MDVLRHAAGQTGARHRLASSRAWRLSAFAIALVSFVTCALIVTAVSRTIAPPPSPPVLEAKLGDLSTRREQIEAVFIGSSRIATTIDPSTLDPALAAQGCPLTTYNLGVPGLHLLEQRALLERLSKIDLPRLKWIFLDLPLTLEPSPDRFSVARFRATMRFANMPLALRDLWTAPISLPKRLWSSAMLGLGFAYEQSGLGAIAALLDPPANDGDGGSDLARIDRARAGFMPLARNSGYADLERRRAAFEQRERAGFEVQLRAAVNRPLDATISPARLDFLATLAREAMIGHAKVGYVIMPEPTARAVGNAKALAARWSVSQGGYVLANMNDPASLPAYGDASAWFDVAHLWQPQAIDLSARLAAPLCAAIGRDTKPAVASSAAGGG